MSITVYMYIGTVTPYSQVPIKRVGPNKRVGWVFLVFHKRLGPNKRVEWGKFCQKSINE